jgi:hypothetical protein
MYTAGRAVVVCVRRFIGDRTRVALSRTLVGSPPSVRLEEGRRGCGVGSIGDGVITWSVCGDYVMRIMVVITLEVGRAISKSTTKAEIVDRLVIVVSQC